MVVYVIIWDQCVNVYSGTDDQLILYVCDYSAHLYRLWLHRHFIHKIFVDALQHKC